MGIKLQYCGKYSPSRGYALNTHLDIDYDNKTYRLYTDIYIHNAVEVVRRNDLKSMAETLDNYGFKRVA